MSDLKEIPFTSIGGFRIGNAHSLDGMTGVTALVFDKDTDNVCGIDISGGGPAARESYLFTPLASSHPVNALLFSGGSAYGLSAAGGAMAFLEERGMGYNAGGTIVPIVPESCIFDLAFGNGKIRPDFAMGYSACRAALEEKDGVQGKDERGNILTSGAAGGNVGAGLGATVGKVYGMRRAQKCGIGYAAFENGGLKMGAVVVVNAFGDIYDFRSGKKIAGAMNEERSAFAESTAEEALLFRQKEYEQNAWEGMNTTIGAVITNGIFSQQQLCRIAAMTRSALSRSINPVGTNFDGDTIYAISVAPKDGVRSDVNIAGVLACRALSCAIIDAAKKSRMENEEFLSFIRT